MELKLYPKYKDSGILWIREIPEGWEVHRLKFLLSSLESGSRETGGGSQLDEGVFSLGGEHINWDGTLNLENPKLISEDYYNSMNQGKLKINDVLLVKDGATIGKTAILKEMKYKKMAVNEHIFLMRANKRIKPKLLYYLISSDSGFKQIKLTETGSAQGGINQDFKGLVLFTIPPNVKEQDSLISFLDKKTAKIDALIEKDKKLIALLKEKRTALINQVVTKGLDPNVKLKDSGIEWIGKIPEGWEVHRQKFLVSKINSGITPKGGAEVYEEDGIPLLRSQNIHFEGLRLNDVAFIPEEIHKTMLNSVVKNHDVLINITGASIGRCTYVNGEFEKANVNQHVCIIRPKKINYKYLTYFLISKHGQDQVFSIQMGSSREGLNFEQLGNFVISFPPLPDQTAIANFLDKATSKIDKTIQKIEKKIKLLEEYKKSLIHHVVTGKVDVRGLKHETY
ncbi:MAG: restriction endonuclease subunit S [Caldiserica bacterium]|nr:MAG: restriction endonuclease subunit S [Caldisericota bacterium]